MHTEEYKCSFDGSLNFDALEEEYSLEPWAKSAVVEKTPDAENNLLTKPLWNQKKKIAFPKRAKTKVVNIAEQKGDSSYSLLCRVARKIDPTNQRKDEDSGYVHSKKIIQLELVERAAPQTAPLPPSDEELFDEYKNDIPANDQSQTLVMRHQDIDDYYSGFRETRTKVIRLPKENEKYMPVVPFAPSHRMSDAGCSNPKLQVHQSVVNNLHHDSITEWRNQRMMASVTIKQLRTIFPTVCFRNLKQTKRINGIYDPNSTSISESHFAQHIQKLEFENASVKNVFPFDNDREIIRPVAAKALKSVFPANMKEAQIKQKVTRDVFIHNPRLNSIHDMIPDIKPGISHVSSQTQVSTTKSMLREFKKRNHPYYLSENQHTIRKLPGSENSSLSQSIAKARSILDIATNSKKKCSLPPIPGLSLSSSIQALSFQFPDNFSG